jgi:hypothetical protein
VTRIELYTHGLLTEELVDSDDDGNPDYRIKHDAFGNTSERLPSAPAK